jgi:hypothetical protein
MVDVGDAEALQVLAILPPDADRDAGHMVARHRRFDPLVELAEQRIGRRVARNRRALRPRASSLRSQRQRGRARRHQRAPRHQHPAANWRRWRPAMLCQRSSHTVSTSRPAA